MKPLKPCINSFVEELCKIAGVMSPAQQLFSASRIGRASPINIAGKPPLPQMGKIGKLPSFPSTTATGLNASAITRSSASMPKVQSVGTGGTGSMTKSLGK